MTLTVVLGTRRVIVNSLIMLLEKISFVSRIGRCPPRHLFMPLFIFKRFVQFVVTDTTVEGLLHLLILRQYLFSEYITAYFLDLIALYGRHQASSTY